MQDIGHTLAQAPPSLLVEHLAQRLRDECGISDVELLLVDYRLATLLPLRYGHDGGDPPVWAPNDPAWRCFDGQAPVVAGDALYLPVTTRGERLGVLRLAPADATQASSLANVGQVLGHELATARASTDRYLVGARARRLTLAAEMQWEILPGRSLSTEAFDLAGQLEPAYAVRGDTFDWSSNVDKLSIAMLNGMGQGVAAASLSILATSALRNARRAGLPLADQAALADAALYAHHHGEQYSSALLLEFELSTGRLTGVDTGAPLILLSRAEQLEELTFPNCDPLGMFDGSHYAASSYQLEPGDRLIIVSDGVHQAMSGSRRYGEADLARLVRRTRGLTPLDVVRTQIGELAAFVNGPLADDAAIVCLDWHGAPALQ